MIKEGLMLAVHLLLQLANHGSHLLPLEDEVVIHLLVQLCNHSVHL